MKQKRELYRISEKGKIAGVCAGVAEYFGLEVWLVRILTVTGFFLLAGPFVIVTYIAAWFILDKKPKGGLGKAAQESAHLSDGKSYRGKGWRNDDELDDGKVEVKTNVWQAGEPPKQAFFDINRKFLKIEQRLRNVETYVTSSEYQLNREINKL
ncbi:envelope stress response membrane protein PspC [Aestuariibacter sp. AA17]|uniref:Envelope stress response membrane protein PspC n=1 Tax=Fluctibacter corallii TaxID=2984329 RepID=A0ABT3A3A1_9ALTE|nr:envelope stress response membrane protein PspC [Aestuariibacter sp. AA17]MCV2883152.1 envelope stress response membrane protein PspC [Aestuariibacter sp. AA17]